MARKDKNEETVVLKFTRPTLDYAIGDIKEFTEEFVDEVVDPYIATNFPSDQQDRYEITTIDFAPKAAKIPEVTIDELRDEALGLGIDVTNLNSKKKLEKAIAEVTA